MSTDYGNGRYESSNSIRCPHCGQPDKVENFSEGLLAEGETSVECKHCKEHFRVTTTIFYQFYSEPVGRSNEPNTNESDQAQVPGLRPE